MPSSFTALPSANSLPPVHLQAPPPVQILATGTALDLEHPQVEGVVPSQPLQVGLRIAASHEMHEKRDYEQDQEYVEEHLRYGDRRSGKAGEAEGARDERDDEECEDPG
jgi:hypothetical protein